MLPQFSKIKFLKLLFAILIIIAAFSHQLKAQAVVDATTLNNKIMAGYQGWFRTPGDRPENKGWAHLFNSATPIPAKLAFDTWPDMSELSADEKYAAPGFTNPDGSQAYLYSAQNPKTVLRHFQWMKQYGIDGVWLSEFCGHFPGGRQESDTTAMLTIMRNVRSAATATGRTWAFMWDMSGLPGASAHNVILNQWKKMVDQGVTTDPRYMHQNGKPVLLIWGFFPDRPGSQPEFCKSLVDFLEAPGKYQAALVGGVDPTWRARGTAEFQAMLMSMTALQPWSVGRAVRDSTTGYKIQNTKLWAGDMEKCKANNVIFIPVFNAGTNVAGPPPISPKLPSVPRRNGNYLWEQFVAASKTKQINSIFVAMFDEINEGTQIMKITSTPPTQAPFLTYEGSTNDWYLRLTALGGKMLKEGTPVPDVIPISPFDPNKWYTIKNKASGLVLGIKDKTIAQIAEAHGDKNLEWQITYDGNGDFKLKSRQAGKMLNPGRDASLTLAKDTKADNLKWHLEWDGTGYSKIVSKATNKAISNNTATPNTPVMQDTNPNSDDFRWQIIENN
ncbi:MAG TPA: RICIN domain-containing protein [Mucilaginibacter sp.]|jgi:hypothetical protein